MACGLFHSKLWMEIKKKTVVFKISPILYKLQCENNITVQYWKCKRLFIYNHNHKWCFQVAMSWIHVILYSYQFLFPWWNAKRYTTFIYSIDLLRQVCHLYAKNTDSIYCTSDTYFPPTPSLSLPNYHSRTVRSTQLNSLGPGKCSSNLKNMISDSMYRIEARVFTAIVLRWMPQHLTNENSTLVQVMAWCHQATCHYLSQWWPRIYQCGR